MSTAFTSPLSGADLAVLAAELVNAGRERALASYFTPGDLLADPLPAGTDLQENDLWCQLQRVVSDPLFYPTGNPTVINDVDGPISADGKTLRKYTPSEFASVAGLNNSAIEGEYFRRVTDWTGTGTPTFSYGFMQPGDIIGWWVIDDLQKAFSAMRLFVQLDSASDLSVISDATGNVWNTGNLHVSKAGLPAPGNWSQLQAAVDALADSSGYHTTEASFPARYVYGQNSGAAWDTSKHWSSAKIKAMVQITSIPHDLSFYWRIGVNGSYAWTFDPYSTGLTQDQLALVNTISASTSTTEYSDAIGGSVPTLQSTIGDIAMTWCPDPTSAAQARGYVTTKVAAIASFDFTYSN